ncbi:hypothetical protein KGF56_003561 [Candida oxycetoniae]|uniref:NAD(P)-binding protein n=1 Tax=Candida oxycetoniae TaxID=497107 RepID=A0AAI9SVJ4_9ASCO|nr:uncharacterized protein KGF56_003561 [Candida oxycetoniae]KAI3403634.2 hypothetical protein KGF56_003561 [Candida oxycetoniae]
MPSATPASAASAPDIDSFRYLNPNKDRRVAIITGGNSGIGFFTVLHLYLHGYIIYIAGRTKFQFSKLGKELHLKAMQIRQQYQPQELLQERYLGELNYLELDMTNLQSIIRAVESFKYREDYLHLLINNAEVIALPYTLTQDNFDIQLQTDFIAPFLLTMKLLPILERTSDEFPDIENPRVIYLSSTGHRFAIKSFNLSSPMNYRLDFIFTWLRYGIAKTAGIHFMKMLSLRNPKILFLCIHPGFAMNTDLFTFWTSLPIIGVLFWCFFKTFAWFLGITSEQGATKVLRTSLNPNLTVEENNGKYYDSQGREAQPSRVASNMDYAARTWIWTIRELNERGIKLHEV